MAKLAQKPRKCCTKIKPVIAALKGVFFTWVITEWPGKILYDCVCCQKGATLFIISKFSDFSLCLHSIMMSRERAMHLFWYQVHLSAILCVKEISQFDFWLCCSVLLAADSWSALSSVWSSSCTSTQPTNSIIDAVVIRFNVMLAWLAPAALYINFCSFHDMCVLYYMVLV